MSDNYDNDDDNDDNDGGSENEIVRLKLKCWLPIQILMVYTLYNQTFYRSVFELQ